MKQPDMSIPTGGAFLLGSRSPVLGGLELDKLGHLWVPMLIKPLSAVQQHGRITLKFVVMEDQEDESTDLEVSFTPDMLKTTVEGLGIDLKRAVLAFCAEGIQHHYHQMATELGTGE